MSTVPEVEGAKDSNKGLVMNCVEDRDTEEEMEVDEHYVPLEVNTGWILQETDDVAEGDGGKSKNAQAIDPLELSEAATLKA